MRWLCFTLITSFTLIAAQSWAQQSEDAQEVVGPQLKQETAQIPSLMFSETDVRNLEKVVLAVNAKNNGVLNWDEAGFSDDDIFQEILRRAAEEQKAKEEETTLPDFYVSTIVYRSAKDWSIWLRKYAVEEKKLEKLDEGLFEGLTPQASGISSSISTPEPAPQITPGSPGGSQVVRLTSDEPVGDNDRLRVASITSQSVTLAYKPDAIAAAFNRYRDKETPTDRMRKFNNRMVGGAEINYDKKAGEFLVTLRPNQTFSANMMRVVEGKTMVPKASSPAPKQSGVTAPSASEAAYNAAMTKDRLIADQLINNIEELQKFMPTPSQPEAGAIPGSSPSITP